MKKCCMILLFVLLLSGCSAQQTFERVYDDLLLPVMAPVAQLQLQLPSSAAQPVLANDTGERLYFCDGYTLAVQTLEAGDLDKSLQSLCGYGREELTLLETKAETHSRYDWAFTCAGEGGTQVGRGAILDDGNYHYCVTVMAQESLSGALQDTWNDLFESLSLKG